MSKKKQSDNLIDALVFIRVLGVGNCSFVRAEDVTERLFVNIKKDPKPQHFGIITKKKKQPQHCKSDNCASSSRTISNPFHLNSLGCFTLVYPRCTQRL